MAQKIASLYAEIGADTSGLTKGLANTKQQLGSAANEAGKLSTKIGSFAAGFGKFAVVGGVAALGAAFVDSTKAAMDLETEFGKIASLTNTPASAIADLRKEVMAMSTELPVGAQELSKALYFISSSGFQGADAMNILKTSAQAATAGLGETKVIADAVTSALNAYGTGAADATRITDLLTFAVKEGKGEPAELAGSLGRILPVAAAAKVGMEDIAAAMSVMTRTGMNAEEAATALRGTIGALLAPAKESVEALAAIGLTTQDVANMLQQPGGLVNVLRVMLERTGGNVEQLDKIIPNIRALTGVLSLAGSQGEEYARVLKDAYDAEGLTADAAAKMGDTMEAKLAKARNSVENLGVALTEKLLPGLGQAADAATTLINWQDKLNTAYDETSKSITKNAGTYEEYKSATVGIARAAGMVRDVWKMGQGTVTEYDARVKILTEDEWLLARSMESVQQGARNQASVYAVLDAAMASTGAAAEYQAVQTEKATKEAGKLAEKTAEATAANLDFVESFKDIDAMSLARAEMERLTALMKSDPENIEKYKAAYVALQEEFGLVTPAALAASDAFEILSQMHQAGLVNATEFKTALDNLQAAAKDGKVGAEELGLSLANIGAFAEIAKRGVEEFDSILSQIERDIRVQMSVVFEEGDIPDMGRAGRHVGKSGVKMSGVKAARGADFIVPPGYNENYPIYATSGERVQVTPRGQDSGAGVTNNTTISINIGAISREYTPQQAGDEIVNRLRARGIVA